MDRGIFKQTTAALLGHKSLPVTITMHGSQTGPWPMYFRFSKQLQALYEQPAQLPQTQPFPSSVHTCTDGARERLHRCN